MGFAKEFDHPSEVIFEPEPLRCVRQMTFLTCLDYPVFYMNICMTSFSNTTLTYINVQVLFTIHQDDCCRITHCTAKQRYGLYNTTKNVASWNTQNAFLFLCQIFSSLMNNMTIKCKYVLWMKNQNRYSGVNPSLGVHLLQQQYGLFDSN